MPRSSSTDKAGLSRAKRRALVFFMSLIALCTGLALVYPGGGREGIALMFSLVPFVMIICMCALCAITCVVQVYAKPGPKVRRLSQLMRLFANALAFSLLYAALNEGICLLCSPLLGAELVLELIYVFAALAFAILLHVYWRGGRIIEPAPRRRSGGA